MIPYLAIAILLLVVAAIRLYFRRKRSSGTAARRMQTRNDERLSDHDLLTNLLIDLETDAIAEGEDSPFFGPRN